MSMPTIPDLNGSINITRSQSKTLLLVSIGLEELALAHIINAEAEKIQHVLHDKPCVEELLAINASVQAMLKEVIKKEILLELKLEEVAKLGEQEPHS